MSTDPVYTSKHFECVFRQDRGRRYVLTATLITLGWKIAPRLCDREDLP